MATSTSADAARPPLAGVGATPGLSAARRREAIQGVLFIAPWILGFVAFTAYPMLASFYYSFTDYKILGAPSWIGLRNYAYAFAGAPIANGDPRFYLALLRTVTWVAATVPTGILGSLLVATLLNRQLSGTSIFRTCFFLPSLTPVVAASLLWSWILQPDIGVVNSIIHTFTGLHGPNWLYSIELSLPSLMVIALWTSIGGDRMIIFLAGLQGIPQEIYDAAKTDGANAFQTWRHVTVPLVTPAILFTLVLGVISSFRVFALAFVTTAGGPAYATYFYALHLYTQAFSSYDMGYASALAWILFVIVLTITLIQMRFSRRWVHYESQR
jgi:multiple sugar transport system permease protein